MKKLLVTLLVIFWCTVVVAQQPSTKKAYMGVLVSEVSEALLSHLGLEKDKGFIIEELVEGAPASQAGLKKYDIILKINNEVLDNTKSLSATIARYKPADKLTLSIIRAGAPMTIEIVLGESAPQLSLQDMKDRIRIVMPKKGETDVQIQIIDAFGEELHEKTHESASPQRALSNKTLEEIVKSNKDYFAFNSSSSVTSSDGEHSITIKMVDDHKSVTVKDDKNEVLFTGDINTAVELQAIPVEFRAKVQELQAKFKLIKP